MTLRAEPSRFGRYLPGVTPGRLAAFVLVLIVGLALALRLYGVSWDEGYPYTPHPDERAILQHVNDISPPPLNDLGQLFNAEESSWNPKWFPYGSLPLYLLKGIEVVYEGISGNELTDLRTIGRVVSALADVVTLLVVYLLASRFLGRRIGFAAAWLMAIAVIHIQLSHFYAVDTLLTMFAALTLFFLYRVATGGKLRDSVLAGLFLGFGLATKTSLLPIFVAFGVAHLMYLFQWVPVRGTEGVHDFSERLNKTIRGLALGVGVGVVAFVAAQPYAIIDWRRFTSDWIEQSEMVQRIRDYPYTRQYIDTPSYWYQIQQLATWGLGWPLGVAAWAGLAFVTLRGMRWRHAGVYAVLGLMLPAVLLVLSHDTKVLMLSGLIAGVALIGTLPVRRLDTRLDVLMLAWVVPYFLMVGAFEVKFMRYMLPITPFLLVMAARLSFALWDSAGEAPFSRLSEKFSYLSKKSTQIADRFARPVLAVVAVGTVAFTGFYAIAYIGVYSQTHPAVRAAEWLDANAAPGTFVLKEHWEELLPELYQFQWQELAMYDADSSAKFSGMTQQLANASYLVFYSNRMYANLTRLDERYPTTGAYYDLLFSGQLGYELVEFETSYPRLWGVSFVDDTFDRPGVPVPEALQDYEPSAASLNLGFADESFTVYDHPKVLIFRNVERFDSPTLLNIIVTEAGGTFGQVSQLAGGPVYDAEDAAAQQAGGTWSEIFPEGSWTNRVPILAWLIVLEGLALLALPLMMLVFRALPDRGYLLSKAAGLLIVGLMVWWLASLRWMAFSTASIGLAAVVLAVVSGVVIAKYRQELTDFVRKNWRIMAVGEAVFLIAFFSFVAIRMANPDLWHPFRGGEKPMELAYLNAVVRSDYMPPYDPWYAGGYLNYYYWGHFLDAMIMKATGIEIRYAFNLAVPMFFALTVGGAFSVAYNLAAATRRRRREDSESDERGAKGLSPVFAGLAGALLVTVLGNLDGAIQIGHKVKDVVLYGRPYGNFDFWRSSRMMPPDPPGHEITEFPFFTFLFADLHPHLMVLPFTLLAIGLGLALVLGARGGRNENGRRWFSMETLVEWLPMLALGVVVGSLAAINTWDYPTYLLLGGGAVVLATFFRRGGLSLNALVEAGLKSLFVFVVGYVAFLPYHMNYETFFSSVEATTNRTVLWQFLAIFGLFVFIIGSFFLYEGRDWLAVGWRGVRRWVADGFVMPPVIDSTGRRVPSGAAQTWRAWSAASALRLGVLALVLAGAGFVMAAYISRPLGSTLPFLALLLLIVFAVGVRWAFSSREDAAPLTFVALMAGLAFALALGLDLYRVEGDVERMNSVFKIYLQVWVLLGVASAYFLWRFACRVRWKGFPRMGVMAWAWSVFAVILIASAGVYTVNGTGVRLNDRFNNTATGLTLDGMAFIHSAVFVDEKGAMALEDDYQGILWLQRNVVGSPVIMEAHTPTYHWGNRIANYTGLPTVIGWQWHQEQQRWDYRGQIIGRISEVDRFYRDADPAVALEILRKYNVQYVYVSTLERKYYPEEGLAKFERMGNVLEVVCCDNNPTTIYRVRLDTPQAAIR